MTMVKSGYSREEIIRFFEDYNLGPCRLAKMLDISKETVKRYLLGGGAINKELAIKIDTALQVIGSQWTAEPVWKVGRNKSHEDWEATCGKWERSMKDVIEEALKTEEERRRSEAEDEIYLILISSDPIANKGGLDNYSTDEFLWRMRQKVKKYYDQYEKMES